MCARPIDNRYWVRAGTLQGSGHVVQALEATPWAFSQADNYEAGCC